MPSEFSLIAYDYNGTALDELVPANVRCSWLINDVGQMEITLPIKQADETLLRFGNLVVMRHESLPAWGGVMWTPRRWGADYVTVSAYDAGLQFKRRISASDIYSGSSGDIMTQLISLANEDVDTRIRAGDIFKGSRPTTFSATFMNLLDILRQTTKATQTEWTFTPNIDQGNALTFAANIYDSMGNQSNFALQEGINLRSESANLQETGEIYNEIFIFGMGANSEEVQRANVIDHPSVYQYGLSQAAFSAKSDNRDLIDAQADATLALYDQPKKTLTAVALNVGATFANMRLGNRPRILLYSVGFKNGARGTFAPMRTIGMEYNAKADTVSANFK